MQPHSEDYSGLHPKAREALESHRRRVARERLYEIAERVIIIGLLSVCALVVISWFV